MKVLLPQDIQANYILPALRREIAIQLIETQEMKQKDVANLMGLTSSAISQYRNLKRGNRVSFAEATQKEIEKAGRNISNVDSSVMQELLRLINLPQTMDIVCKLHKIRDPEAENICSDCHLDPEKRKIVK